MNSEKTNKGNKMKRRPTQSADLASKKNLEPPTDNPGTNENPSSGLKESAGFLHLMRGRAEQISASISDSATKKLDLLKFATGGREQVLQHTTDNTTTLESSHLGGRQHDGY